MSNPNLIPLTCTSRIGFYQSSLGIFEQHSHFHFHFYFPLLVYTYLSVYNLFSFPSCIFFSSLRLPLLLLSRLDSGGFALAFCIALHYSTLQFLPLFGHCLRFSYLFIRFRIQSIAGYYFLASYKQTMFQIYFPVLFSRLHVSQTWIASRRNESKLACSYLTRKSNMKNESNGGRQWHEINSLLEILKDVICSVHLGGCCHSNS